MSGAKVPSPPAAWPVAAAIVLNLIPIVGVVFLGWSAFALIFLYWLENVVIGVRTIASMLVSGPANGSTGLVWTIFFAAFFTMHYGLFCFGHGVFVVLLFGVSQGIVPGDSVDNLPAVVQHVFATQPNLISGLLSIVLWQALLFVLFVVRGQAKQTNPLELMGAPYPRIIVLQLCIIGGGFVLLALNQPLAGLLALALLKMAFDVAQARGQGDDGAKARGAWRHISGANN